VKWFRPASTFSPAFPPVFHAVLSLLSLLLLLSLLPAVFLNACASAPEEGGGAKSVRADVPESSSGRPFTGNSPDGETVILPEAPAPDFPEAEPPLTEPPLAASPSGETEFAVAEPEYDFTTEEAEKTEEAAAGEEAPGTAGAEEGGWEEPDGQLAETPEEALPAEDSPAGQQAAASPASPSPAAPPEPYAPTPPAGAESPGAADGSAPAAAPPAPPFSVQAGRLPDKKPPATKAGEKQVPVSLPPLPARIPPLETDRLYKTAEDDQSFSRESRALTGQFVDIPFKGTGWVFLGERDGQRGLSYDSQKIDPDGQVFAFRADKPGTYYLKFSKQDFINNNYLNDAVKITVGDRKDETDLKWTPTRRILAGPRFPFEKPLNPGTNAAGGNQAGQPVPAASAAGTRNMTGGNPVPAQTPADEGPDTREAQDIQDAQSPDYLALARENFKISKFGDVIPALDNYRSRNPYPDDEFWWMLGQSFEANSPARNIKSALDAYRHITGDFPQSRYYDRAKQRISYINKFYFNIK